MNFPSVPPSRTVTRVRLRGTSLSSPAAIASDTLIRLIGNASPDANNAEYFMKSRRVAAEPQDWLSIPLLHFGGVLGGPKMDQVRRTPGPIRSEPPSKG